jgi:hypothetical protein
MIQWNKRPSEIANLLNPAFCAVILYATIAEYQKKSKIGMPFTLLYLILPIVLHQGTRKKINSKTNMVVWLQRNPDALVGFPDRARSLVMFTNEAIEYLLFQQNVNISDGNLEIIRTLSKSKLDGLAKTDSEIAECIKKAAHVGRWFNTMRAEESIYIAWGVRP